MARSGGSHGRGRSGSIYALAVLVAALGIGRMRDHLVWMALGVALLAVIIASAITIPVASAITAGRRGARRPRRQPVIPIPASFSELPSARTTIVQRRTRGTAQRAWSEARAESAPGSDIDLDDAAPTVHPGADIDFHDITADLPSMGRSATAPASGTALRRAGAGLAVDRRVRPDRPRPCRSSTDGDLNDFRTHAGSSATGGWRTDPSILGSTLSTSSVLSPTGSSLTSTSLTRGDGV